MVSCEWGIVKGLCGHPRESMDEIFVNRLMTLNVRL